MKRILTTLVVALLLIVPATALAAPQSPTSGSSSNLTNTAAPCGEGDNSSTGQALQGLGQTQTGQDCTGSGVSSTIGVVVKVLSYVVGVAAIIMLLVAAFKYISSGGDSNKVASAKRTLIYVIVGLAIAALAQFIVNTTVGVSSDASKAPAANNTSKHGSKN